jgi:hypothetical protein
MSCVLIKELEAISEVVTSSICPGACCKKNRGGRSNASPLTLPSPSPYFPADTWIFPEPEFVNVQGAQEPTPKNRLCQPMNKEQFSSIEGHSPRRVPELAFFFGSVTNSPLYTDSNMFLMRSYMQVCLDLPNLTCQFLHL